MRMYAFLPLQADRNDRNLNGTADAMEWSQLDRSFYTRLRIRSVKCTRAWRISELTSVADIPG